MTLVETIIGGITVAAIASLIAHMFASKNKVTQEDFEKHKSEISPHPGCLIHSTKIDSMEKTLGSMDTKLDKIIEKL